MNFLRAGSCGAAADSSLSSPSSGARVGRRGSTRESSFIFEASLEYWPWAETCYAKFGPRRSRKHDKTLRRLSAARPGGLAVPRDGSVSAGLVSKVPLSNKARQRIDFLTVPGLR